MKYMVDKINAKYNINSYLFIGYWQLRRNTIIKCQQPRMNK